MVDDGTQKSVTTPKSPNFLHNLKQLAEKWRVIGEMLSSHHLESERAKGEAYLTASNHLIIVIRESYTI